MKLKYDCFGCRALNGLGLDSCCLLGYKVNAEKRANRRYPTVKTMTPFPLEPCPKPRTWKQYDVAQEKREDQS